MNKKDFYNLFKGTDTQALATGGTVKVPSKISAKADIIIGRLAGASVGWDYTLAQLQDAVFAHRGAKADWSVCGSFAAKDLIGLTDIRQAMLEVYFHLQHSEYWKGQMLALVATKSGELLLRKVEYIDGFFKEKAVKTETDDQPDGKTDEKKDEAEKKPNLLEDLNLLLKKEYSGFEVCQLADFIRSLEIRMQAKGISIA